MPSGPVNAQISALRFLLSTTSFNCSGLHNYWIWVPQRPVQNCFPTPGLRPKLRSCARITAVGIYSAHFHIRACRRFPCFKDIMAEAHKLFYIIVVDDYSPDRGEGEKSHYSILQRENRSFRYTRPVLQSTLQLMGCKQRHAFKISKRVFDIMRNEIPVKTREIDENGSSLIISHQHLFEAGEGIITGGSIEQGNQKKKEASENDVLNDNDKKPTLYKKRISVVATRENFLDVVCDSLAEYRYMGPNQRADLVRACREG